MDSISNSILPVEQIYVKVEPKDGFDEEEELEPTIVGTTDESCSLQTLSLIKEEVEIKDECPDPSDSNENLSIDHDYCHTNNGNNDEINCDIPNLIESRREDLKFVPNGYIIYHEEYTEFHVSKSRRLYECCTCKKVMCKKKAINKHIVKHIDLKDDGPHECSICKVLFTKKSQLTSHMILHLKKKYTCSICEKCFVKKSCLNAHMKSHLKVKPFECSVCLKRFMKRNTISNHLCYRYEEGIFQCNYCKKDYNSKYLLAVHVETHLKKMPQDCKICLKTFPNAYDLDVHMIRSHKTERSRRGENTGTNDEKDRFRCSKCLKYLFTKSELNDHIKLHKERKRIHKCDKCDTSFSKEEHYVKHMNLHAVSTNKCFVCKKDFISKSILEKHIKYRHRKQYYTCNVCSKSFKSRIRCERHKVIKHNEAIGELACHICNQTFCFKSVMEKHMKKHVNSEPRDCPKCLQRCENFKALKLHLKNHNEELHKVYEISSGSDNLLPKTEYTIDNPVIDELKLHLKNHNEELHKVYESSSGSDNLLPKTEYTIDTPGIDELKLHLKSHNEELHKVYESSSGSDNLLPKTEYTIDDPGIDEKRYKCYICFLAFTKQKTLKMHMKKHRTVKYFKCVFCEKRYKHLIALNSHQRYCTK